MPTAYTQSPTETANTASKSPPVWEKQPGDGDRCCDTNGGCEQHKKGLLHAPTTCRQGCDRYRSGGRSGRFELKPEARIQRNDDGKPNSQREYPGARRKSREDQWAWLESSTCGVHLH